MMMEGKEYLQLKRMHHVLELQIIQNVLRREDGKIMFLVHKDGLVMLVLVLLREQQTSVDGMDAFLLWALLTLIVKLQMEN